MRIVRKQGPYYYNGTRIAPPDQLDSGQAHTLMQSESRQPRTMNAGHIISSIPTAFIQITHSFHHSHRPRGLEMVSKFVQRLWTTSKAIPPTTWVRLWDGSPSWYRLPSTKCPIKVEHRRERNENGWQRTTGNHDLWNLRTKQPENQIYPLGSLLQSPNWQPYMQ